MNKKKYIIGVLIAVIVIGIAVAVVIKTPLFKKEKTAEEKLLEKPGKTLLYFSPHQDDEMLTEGIDIAVSIENGYDVHVILCTDGSICNVKEKLNNGKHCKSCNTDHNYMVTTEEFVQSRDSEFIGSCLALGVKRDNIHIEETRMVDGSETAEGTKEIIKKYLELFGKNCTVCAVFPNDPEVQHRDHNALGLAATELKDEGVIKNLYLFEEPYNLEKVSRGDREEPNIYYASDEIMTKLQKAVDEYHKWDPENGRYAVGYHSAGERMENVLSEKALYYHIYE